MPSSFGFSKLKRKLKRIPSNSYLFVINTNLTTNLIYGVRAYGTGSPNYTIDWGNGIVETFDTYGYKTHTYASHGIYHVKVNGSFGKNACIGFKAIDPVNSATNLVTNKLRKVLRWGNLPGIDSLEGIGRAARNLISVPSYLPLNVTDTSLMFSGASRFNQPIGNWNVSNVTNMVEMFDYATNFNQNLSDWQIRNANLTNMFDDSALDADNYSKTLIGWSNYVFSTGNAKSKVLGAGGLKYNATIFNGTPYNTGSGARSYLTTPTPTGGGWTITGDAQE